MVAQDKITSGFDVEFLMGEEYIKYFLLSSITETTSSLSSRTLISETIC
jgi:hypothetical protein